MKFKMYSIFMGILLFAQPLFGQQPDPIVQYSFPAALVMQNQQAADLGDEQKKAIKTQIRESEVKFQELQWNLQDEMETFASLLTPSRIDEQKALAQLEEILKIEAQIKREHLALQIRIKNVLTPDQQEKLQQIRKAANPLTTLP